MLIIYAWCSSLPPKSIGACGELPQLDRAILTARGVYLAIRREHGRPYRTVVTLANFCNRVSKVEVRAEAG